LHISNTDISEFDINVGLSDSTETIYYSTKERPESKLKNITKKLDDYLTKRWLDKNYTKDKRNDIKQVNIYSKGLKGELDLGDFVNLEELNCYNNELTSIDISKNIKLKKLNCSDNKLKEVNLEKNIELKELKCVSNELGELTLNNNVNLEEIYCSNNELTNLDIIKNTKLKKLDCSDNMLTKLELQGLSDLTELNCSNNKLTELSGIEKENVKLIKLNISGNNNNLSEQKVIELSKLPNLIEFEEKEGR